MAVKKGLGRGLDILLPETDEPQGAMEIALSDIDPNPEQPRREFDKAALEQLAESIRQSGILQPLLVTREGQRYRIVAGERRYRAARLAGLHTVPCLVRDLAEHEKMEAALIENLQREDLNPIEEALSYKALLDDFSLTQEQVSEQVGKSRSAIANSIRLLSLPQKVREMLEAGTLSSGHARAILSVNNEDAKLLLAEKIVENALSVRQAEQLAKTLNAPKKEPKKTTVTQLDLQLGEIQKRMSDILGTKVKILNGAKKGKIEIEYYSANDLERLLRILDI